MDCLYKDTCKYGVSNACIGADNCIKRYKINSLKEMALLSEPQKQHIDLYLDNNKIDKDPYMYLKQLEKDIINFVACGSNLFICSSICGNGKTSWALRLLNKYLESIWYYSTLECHGLFINVPNFLIGLKDNIGVKQPKIEYIKNNVLNADVVIWDDIATKGFTEYETENLLSLINCRIERKLSNIYTSNCFGEPLRELIGDRLYSRVFSASEVIEFKGADKRGMRI